MNLRLKFIVAGLPLLMLGCDTTHQDNATQSISSDSSHNSHDDKNADHSHTMVEEEEHIHPPGSHGGTMISLGRDSYHVEVVIDSEGTIRLYTLGQDETRVIDIESQKLQGFIKTLDSTDAQSINFEPSPQAGDGEGKTSLFIAKMPAEFSGKQLEVTIPNIRIEGERFRLSFQTKSLEHFDTASMPDKIGSDSERELYLTPGGRYTTADIVANGNKTASEKFKGIKSEHDMKPEPGDKLCPISGTKANSNFTWIIDGKTYEFCCPPCVDEFLSNAKSSTEPLADPSTLIKQ